MASRIANDIHEAVYKDSLFEPERGIEFGLLAFTLIYFIPTTYIYYKNRKNILIKYRQPRNVIIGSMLSVLNASAIPIIRVFKVICLVNTWVNSSLIFSFVMLTFSRYIRLLFIQRLSIFKLKFSQKKNKKIHDTGNSALKRLNIKAKDKSYNSNSIHQVSNSISSNEKSVFIEPLNAKEKSIIFEKGSEKDVNKERSCNFEIFDTVSSLKSASTSKMSKEYFSSDKFTFNSYNVLDPSQYYKKLNEIINKKITIYFVVCPIFFLCIYYFIITIKNWDQMIHPCLNESGLISLPKIVLNGVIITSSGYLFYQAYYKQKWDREIKIEYTIFVFICILCIISMRLAIVEVLGKRIFIYRLYIFQLIPFTLQFICVIVPLIKIYIKSKMKNEKMLEVDEFLHNLGESSFREQVREIATKTFCVENLLFIEAHCDLMNIIISYYSRRTVIDDTYSYEDIYNKTTLNPLLYKPFDPIFKSQYDQIYYLYIKEGSIASVNLNSEVVAPIEDQMENNNYSYLMYNQAVEEVCELLYSNVYPRMHS